MKDNYRRAYKEVLEIIKYFPEDEYNRIPQEKIEFFKNNMDNEYEFSIDPSVDLGKQNISREANAIIVNLYQDYFATEEQKKKIIEILELNKKKAEAEKSKKYNSDDLFANKNTREEIRHVDVNDNSLVESKDNFWTNFKNFILKLLHIK